MRHPDQSGRPEWKEEAKPGPEPSIGVLYKKMNIVGVLKQCHIPPWGIVILCPLGNNDRLLTGIYVPNDSSHWPHGLSQEWTHFPAWAGGISLL